MSDLISRQAALRTFGLSEKSRKYGGDHSGYQTIMLYEVQDALEALPSEPRWIPVSEKLPEEDTEVLVCSDENNIEVASFSRSTEIEGAVIWLTSGWRFGKVTAWMPLPEPYKGGEE